MDKILEAMAMWDTLETLTERDRWEIRVFSEIRVTAARYHFTHKGL